jgi:hypothetical protein
MRSLYDGIIKKDLPKEHQAIAKSAFSGLLWTKQFYYYDVLNGFWWSWRSATNRSNPRNASWQHLLIVT